MTNLSKVFSSEQINAVERFLQSQYSVVTFIQSSQEYGVIFYVEKNDHEFPVIATFTHENRLILNTLNSDNTSVVRLEYTYEIAKLESLLYSIELDEKKKLEREQNMNNVKMINELDCLVFTKTFRIGIGYGSEWYGVHANCEQDALDILVDWFEENEYHGMYSTYAEVIEYHNDLDDEELDEMVCSGYIVAGNHCHFLEADKIVISEIR
jgi:hypothetical protein